MIRLLILLGFLACQAGVSYANTEPRRSGEDWYEVASVSGSVLTRSPASAKWRRLRRDDKVKVGQLIQVTPGAFVSLKRHAAHHSKTGSQLSAKQATLVIHEPIVFRLGLDILRKVRLTEHYLSKIPIQATDLDQERGLTENLPLFFDEAWEKVAAVFELRDSTADLLPVQVMDKEKHGTALALTSKRIKIITPYDQSLVPVQAFPGEVKIAWSKAPRSQTDYYIYLWPKGEKHGPPVAVTKDDHYTLTVHQARTYHLQVTTADGQWRAPSTTLHVVTPDMFPSASTMSSKDQSHRSQQPSIVVDYPPSSFEMIIADQTKAAVDIYWRSPVTLPSIASVVIEPVGGMEDQKRRLRAQGGPKTSTLLKPGVYKWWVEVMVINNRRRKIMRSQPRQIVIKTQPAPLASGLVKSLLQPGITGTFDLSEGL